MNATSHIDSQLSIRVENHPQLPNTDSRRSNSDIATALYKANMKQIWQVLGFLLFFIIVCSLAGLILINIASRSDNSNMVLFGVVLLAVGLVLGFTF